VKRPIVTVGLLVLAYLVFSAQGVWAVDERAAAMKEEVMQQLREIAEQSGNEEEFGSLLQGAGYEVDMAESLPQDYLLGAPQVATAKATLTKCVCDIPYPWPIPGWAKLVWNGTVPADGNAFISMIWGDPNYDLELFLVVFDSNWNFKGFACSAYTVTNMESLNEDGCLGGCWFHTGNPFQLNQGDHVSVWVYMSNMYGVSGPMEFSMCGHLEQ